MKLRVGIIGTGNVGTHLVTGLQQAGVELVVIYSRTLAHAQELSQRAPGIVATDVLDFTHSPVADVYLIAVPDHILPSLMASAKFPAGVTVAHTSGTQPLEVLAELQEVQTGVFYPLQTFSKEKEIDWSRIPLCLEASHAAGEAQLQALAQKLSEVVVPMGGAARKQLHVAAVFACNFVNHLWGISHQVLQQANLPFPLLEPLLQETLSKALLYPPFTVQTGPAQRKDQSTIEAHLHLLEASPLYQNLYQALTQSIQATAENGLFSGKDTKNAL